MMRRLRQRLYGPLLRAAAARRPGSAFAAALWFGLFQMPAALRLRRNVGLAAALHDGFRAWTACVRHRLTLFEWRQVRHRPGDLERILAAGYSQIDLMAGLTRLTIPEALRAKPAMAEACRQEGLPHPETVVFDGTSDVSDLVGRHAPVFVKPAAGHGSRGVAVLAPDRQGGWRLLSRTGTHSGTGWRDLLAAHMAGEVLVLQPCLLNCASVAALVGPSLLTIRVVTRRRGIEPAETISALAEIPLDGTLPLPRAIEVRAVDVDSGRTGKAIAAAPEGPSRHASVTAGDLLVADWPALRNLACRAHDSIAPGMPTVGWDLATTDAGPLLIEGNANWNLLPHLQAGLLSRRELVG